MVTNPGRKVEKDGVLDREVPVDGVLGLEVHADIDRGQGRGVKIDTGLQCLFFLHVNLSCECIIQIDLYKIMLCRSNVVYNKGCETEMKTTTEVMFHNGGYSAI